MVTTVIGAGAIAIARIQVRTAAASRDAAEAGQYAAAAIEIGRYLISQDPNWRTNRTSGVWVTNQAIGKGTFSLSVTDPADNDFTNSYTDSVLLTATGVKGSARSKLSLKLVPSVQPLNCLNVVGSAGGNLYFNNSKSALTIRTDQTLSTNATAVASSANVYSRVETVTGATGSTFYGSTTLLSTARYFPTSTVFDWYISHGTTISYASISSAKINKVLLSAGVNPYGAQTTNPRGIYIVDCGGGDLTVTDCRIVGTLVLLNCGTCTVTPKVVWQASAQGYPILMVQGKLVLDCDPGTTVDESTVNYTPSHTPYRGTSNTNTSDKLATEVSGLIYATSDISLSRKQTVTGCLVSGGTLGSTGGTIELTYSSASTTNPPPSFMVWPPPMQIVTGSLAQVVDP